MHEQTPEKRQYLQVKEQVLTYTLAVVNLPAVGILLFLKLVGVDSQIASNPLVFVLLIAFEAWCYTELYAWLKRRKRALHGHT